MREGTFSGASVDHVGFVECDLTRSTFARVQLQNSEMRRCKLSEVQGFGELRGVAMEWPAILQNAQVFAAELGIRIADTE